MERIYLTDDEKTVLRKMWNLPNYGIDAKSSGFTQEKYNSIMTSLEYKGLINAIGKTEQLGYFLCVLSDKGITYIENNSDLTNPKTEEEKEQSRRRWELKMNAADWLVTIIAGIVGAIVGVIASSILTSHFN